MKSRLSWSLLATALIILRPPLALAWNGAGHRLVAEIAWRQMSPAARQQAVALLQRHPDHTRWLRQAGEDSGHTAFVEAATWPDDIRGDPRFYDETRPDETPTPPLPGLSDTARHKQWHYVDLQPDGTVRAGELDRQIERLLRRLRTPGGLAEEKSYALPWLIHLVGDIHQPLHVGNREDEGGNRFEIEDTLNARQPFINLHAWWDDLPGPPWLRGRRLEAAADKLLAENPIPPAQGNIAIWRRESWEIGRSQAYPRDTGSLLPAVTPDFQAQSRAIARRRLAEAGYRLGRLLEASLGRVSRETE